MTVATCHRCSFGVRVHTAARSLSPPLRADAADAHRRAPTASPTALPAEPMIRLLADVPVYRHSIETRMLRDVMRATELISIADADGDADGDPECRDFRSAGAVSRSRSREASQRAPCGAQHDGTADDAATFRAPMADRGPRRPNAREPRVSRCGSWWGPGSSMAGDAEPAKGNARPHSAAARGGGAALLGTWVRHLPAAWCRLRCVAFGCAK